MFESSLNNSADSYFVHFIPFCAQRVMSVGDQPQQDACVHICPFLVAVIRSIFLSLGLAALRESLFIERSSWHPFACQLTAAGH